MLFNIHIYPEIIQGEIKALDQSCSSCAKLMTSYKDVTTREIN